MKLLKLSILLIGFIACTSFSNATDSVTVVKTCNAVFYFFNRAGTSITNIHITQGSLLNESGGAASGGSWHTTSAWQPCSGPTIFVSWTCSASGTYYYNCDFPDGASSNCKHYTGTGSSTSFPQHGQGEYDFYVSTTGCL